MREIGKALIMYMGDNNNRTPPASWSDGLSKYAAPEYFACPLLAPYGYTMNADLIAIDAETISSPALTIAAFDGKGGKDSIGGASDIRWRHLGMATFLYLDGHARMLRQETFEGLTPPDD